MTHCAVSLPNRVLCAILSLTLVFTVGWSATGSAFAEENAAGSFVDGGSSSFSVESAIPLTIPEGVLGAGAVLGGADDLADSTEMSDDLLDSITAQLSNEDVAEAEAQAAADERATDVSELGYMPGELVVIYENAASDAQVESALESIDAEEVSEQIEFDLGTAAKVVISDDLTVETAAELVEADPAVKYALPNYIAESYDTPSAELMTTLDTSFSSSTAENYTRQWHLNFVKAPDAWASLANSGKKFSKVKVAIIDTGASLTHSDLSGVINTTQSIEVVYTDVNNAGSWTQLPLAGDGRTNGGVFNDTSSHGTHVSGIVAAESKNGGVLGVASGGSTSIANTLVDLVVIDAFSLYAQQSNGSYAASATLQDILFALNYAKKNQCKIANMSLGFPATDEKLNATLEQLTTELTVQSDMVLIAAAGNGGNNTPSVPAMCSNVIAVTNVDSSSKRASTSSYGSWCDIAAPGENILSTLRYKDSSGNFRDGYGTMSGTSMASPVVVGVAAMVRAANTSLTAQQVRNVLCSTATPLSGGSDLGSGLVNAKAAVDSALATTQTTPKTIALSASNVTLSNTSFTYSGSAQRPTFTVKYNGATLKSGTDYSYAYSNSSSRAVGLYYLTVTGKGSYTNGGTVYYRINAANLSNATISSLPTQQYTGRAITPAVTVKMGGNLLKQNTDYTVTYSNNVKAGTASVRIVGKGNYTGARTVYFTIKGNTPSVAYACHVQNIGWQAEVRDGALGGTSGRALRVEAFRVRLVNQPYSGDIRVSAHVQNVGWQGWVSGSSMALGRSIAGTSGRALRVEALRVELTGQMASYYDVYYRTHCQNVGWTGWARNGARCGTAGYGYRMEAVQIRLVPKGSAAPGPTANAFVSPLVSYRTHVQNVGWQAAAFDGATGGTSGRALRVEAFRVSLVEQPCSGSIQVSSHVQNIGWQGWASDGATSGTSGRALRVEALRIRLTGQMASRYDVYYRTHCQNVGWTGWARNGDPCGTAGYAYRMEAVQIRLVPKGSAAPGSTSRAFYQRY